MEIVVVSFEGIIPESGEMSKSGCDSVTATSRVAQRTWKVRSMSFVQVATGYWWVD